MIGKVHFYSGIVVVILFVLTGQYMHHQYNGLQDMEMMSRALFRAGHLYILLFGLIHMALGIQMCLSSRRYIQRFQYLGSAIMYLATFLCLYSFFTELPSVDIERPISRYSLYFILTGVSLHGLIFMFTNEDLHNMVKP